MHADHNMQMSGSRIRTSGRFKPCAHMACFDLEAFVELNQRSKKVYHLMQLPNLILDVRLFSLRFTERCICSIFRFSGNVLHA